MKRLTWRVDSSTSRLMTQGRPKQEATKNVGVRMTDAMSKRFKTEAAKRGISGRALFEEMWADYQAKSAK